jgi:hypothetical protein
VNVNKIVEQFNDQFKKMVNEEKELRVKIGALLVKKVEDIWPIVEALKENNVYFTHPDLGDTKTLHGIIVGKNYKNHSEIYVCKTKDTVCKVDTHDDKTEGSPMSLKSFLEVANLDLAVNGIEQTANRPTEVIDDIQHKIEKGRLLLNNLL